MGSASERLPSDPEFCDVIDKMPKYLSALEECPLIGVDPSKEREGMAKRLRAVGIVTYDERGNPIDPAGIYVFYENEKPKYVGRSDNLTARLLMHGRPSSGSEGATFAFILAKECFEQEGFRATRSDGTPMSRKELAKHSRFKPLFDAAKRRVRKMRVRAVGIQDPIEQTIFEVYAHLKLGTPHNSFENH